VADIKSHNRTNLAPPRLDQFVSDNVGSSARTTPHLDYLDGWRGCAILFLLMGHFFPIAGINFGRIGVDLFFVLSGLLMGRLLFIQKLDLKIFYQRRISRIFPAFIVYIACILIYFYASHQTINWLESSVASTFIYNYFLSQIGVPVMPFGHIWSLSVEEHTYIFLSLIAFMSLGKYRQVMAALAIITLLILIIGTTYVYLPGADTNNLLLHTEVACFGIVFSALILLFTQKLPLPTLSTPIFFFLFFCVLASNWWSLPKLFPTFVGVGLLAFLVNALETAPSLIHRILSFLPLRILGLWSYSIYLWQQVFYLAHHRQGLNAGTALVLALACGAASYFLVERPMRRYLNKRWGKRARVAVDKSSI
jgi:peptidoglycan/LPS O-acetylase OafA/YrhL